MRVPSRRQTGLGRVRAQRRALHKSGSGNAHNRKCHSARIVVALENEDGRRVEFARKPDGAPIEHEGQLWIVRDDAIVLEPESICFPWPQGRIEITERRAGTRDLSNLSLTISRTAMTALALDSKYAVGVAGSASTAVAIARRTWAKKEIRP
jgi:hypothetical protein